MRNSILDAATTIIFTFSSRRSPSHIQKVEKKHGKRSSVRKKANITNRKTIHIEWGDCDPAQIVHYPRYLAYFDASTTALLKKAGLPKRRMLKTYQIVGIPMVDLRATF